MGEMRLTVRHLGKGSAMECTTPQGAVITLDEPDTGQHGASPVQHLLSAIGACALMDVDVFLRKKRIAFSDLRVDCDAKRRDAPDYPRVLQEVRLVFHVAGDVKPKAFEDVVKLAVDKYCSVAGTVVEGAKVSYETVITP